MANDRAAKAREARQRNREARRAEQQTAQLQDSQNVTPRTARTPLEREQARVSGARSGADLREAQRIRVEQTGRRPFVGGSTGMGAASLEKSGRQFRILHGAVGEHAMGATVYESQFPENTDFERLLGLEAVVEVGGADADDEEELALLDMDEAPAETLTEAAFSESPPTLPRVDGIDVEPSAVREAMRKGVGTDEPRDESPEAQHEPTSDVNQPADETQGA